MVYIITRKNFLDVIPVAREVLVDNMLDGLLVLDGQNRLIDINPSALKIFNLNSGLKWIGLPAREILASQYGLEQNLDSLSKIEIEWEQSVPDPHFFDVQIFPLYNHAGKISGKTIVLRDITRRKNAEKALQTAYHQLEEKLEQIQKLQDELRDQSIRDALTGLFNRRYIDEIFTGEVARAERENYPLSLIIIDIDHFKDINDTYGHSRGDELLRKLGRAFRTHFRISDIVCRYGGDEFTLIMPNSTEEDALKRIESFRQVYDQFSFDQTNARFNITFSAGTCTFPTHAKSSEDLFRIADQMLYQAKAMGRNRTCSPALKSKD
jgi:diguanylate cyclase (GGDEF)-like protein